MYRPYIS